MFQFTSTLILNSNTDSSGKPKWSAETSATGVQSFFVKRANNFITSNITAAYKREAAAPKLAKAELVLDQWGQGLYQLVVHVNYFGSLHSFYARANEYVQGKPLFYSFELDGTETSTQVADKVTKIVKHLESRFDDKFLKVTNSTNTLSVNAVDEHQRFVRVAIEKFVPLTNACGCTGDCQCGWTSVLEAKPADSTGVFPNPNATIVQGREGFGTYSQLMKDLRLPTAANTNWLAVNQEERPVPGELYNQYTIEYVKDRGVIGQSAVGMTAKSSTLHVFYVKQDLAANFEAALVAAGITLSTQNLPTGYPA